MDNRAPIQGIEDDRLKHPIYVVADTWDGVSEPQLGMFDLRDRQNPKAYAGNGRWIDVKFKKIRLLDNGTL